MPFLDREDSLDVEERVASLLEEAAMRRESSSKHRREAFSTAEAWLQTAQHTRRNQAEALIEKKAHDRSMLQAQDAANAFAPPIFTPLLPGTPPYGGNPYTSPAPLPLVPGVAMDHRFLAIDRVGWGVNARGEAQRPLTLAQAAARRRLDEGCRCTNEERYEPDSKTIFAANEDGYTPHTPLEAIGDLRHQLEAAQEELLDAARNMSRATQDREASDGACWDPNVLIVFCIESPLQ